MSETVSEIDFERAVVELAHLFGWRVASFRPAGTGKGWRTPVKYDGKGYPDLTMVHPDGKVIFAEMKAQRGTLGPEQIAWGQAFENATASVNVHYFVWKPSDAAEIASILSFGRVTDWRV